VRVLVWHGFLLAGTGSNVYNARLCAALARQGHEIVLFSQERHANSLHLPANVRHVRPEIGGLLPVYVAEHVVYFDETLAFPEHHVLEQMKEKLAQLAREQINAEVPVFPHVEKGKPWAEIIRLAEQHEADLIVLGTHGRTGLQHWLLGSTAERVVQHASCPVLVVPPSARSGSQPQRKIL